MTTPAAARLEETLRAFPALQSPLPTDRTPVADHFLASTPVTVRWGRLPCALDDAVLVVDDGATVTIDTVSHEGLLEDQGSNPVAYFGGFGVPSDGVLRDATDITASCDRSATSDGPHVVTGPIEVRGARPGDVLSIEVLELQLRVGYGIVSNRHGRGALPGELPAGPGPSCVFTTVERTPAGPMGCMDAGFGDGQAIRFPLRPFLGLVGVATAGDERLHSVPPGRHGGNLDVSVLGVGSTLHLPVQVDGARFYVGDPHFAQGDGEVALTAFEAPLRATLRVRVVPAAEARLRFGPTARPVGETADLLVAIGLDADLDLAMKDCVRAALELLDARYGVEAALGLAYLSAATDFSVSQVVDSVKGVHACIRTVDFAELGHLHA